jgi:hypothetical protein
MTPGQTQHPVPTPDSIDAAAKKTFDEGLALFKEGTTESLRAAIGKLETARRLSNASKNLRYEASSLFLLGGHRATFWRKAAGSRLL